MCHRLLKIKRKARKPLKKQPFTKTIKQKRLVWAKNYKNWSKTGKKVLLSDEIYFFVQGWHSKYVRISEGEKLSSMHFNQTVKHRLFWGCFNFSDVRILTPIEEMMNLACYTQLIRQTVTCNMQRAFPESGEYSSKLLLHVIRACK